MARISILVLILVAAALGQTSADLNAKYPSVAAFRVRPDVLMTAKFAPDGQVCEMALEKPKKNETGLPSVDSFSKQEVRSLVDELVPESQRGRDLTKRFSGTIEGLSVTTVYTYENVLVHVYGARDPVGASDKLIVITWLARPCDGSRPPTP